MDSAAVRKEQVVMDAINCRELFKEAVVKIVIDKGDSKNPAVFQTAWFFTETGYILSAGHGFNGMKVGKKFSVESPMLDWRGEAILDDYVSGQPGCLDYAILHTEGGLPNGFSYMPVSKMITGTQVPFPQSITGFGFSADLCGTIIFEGKLQFFSYGINNGNNALYQVDTGKYEAPGISGGPIYIENPNGRKSSTQYGVIGLQVEQGAQYLTKHLFFAQPINAIFRHSKLFKDLFHEQLEMDVVRRCPLHRFEEKSFAKERFTPDKHVRRAPILVPQEEANPGHAICQAVAEKKTAFFAKLSAFLTKQKWLDSNRSQMPVRLALHEKGWNYDDTQNPNLKLFLGEDSTNIPQEDIPYLRVIFDLTGSLELSSKGLIERDGRNSHLLVVRLLARKTQWVSVNHPHVDAVLEIEGGNVECGVQAVYSVLEDILLDANIYYCIPILRSLFAGPNGMRAFSYAKVAYAQEAKKLVSGLQLPTDSMRYIALSGTARKSLWEATNPRDLEQVWREFVDKFLFPALLRRDEGTTAPIDDDEVISRFCTTAKIGGQVSAKQLRNAISKLSNKPGELCALAKIVSQPKHVRARNALKNFFQQGGARNGGVGAFACRQLPALCSFQPHVRIFLFCRKNGI